MEYKTQSKASKEGWLSKVENALVRGNKKWNITFYLSSLEIKLETEESVFSVYMSRSINTPAGWNMTKVKFIICIFMIKPPGDVLTANQRF